MSPKHILLSSHSAYINNKILLPQEYLPLMTEDVLEQVSSEIKAFYNISVDASKMRQRQDIIYKEEQLLVVNEVEKKRDETDRLNLKLQEANANIGLVNEELERALLEVEKQKTITEDELQKALRQNTTLTKTQGYISLSKRIIWFVFILCVLPTILNGIHLGHIGELNEKLTDISENLILIAFGGFTSYLMSGTNAKKIETNTGRSSIGTHY